MYGDWLAVGAPHDWTSADPAPGQAFVYAAPEDCNENGFTDRCDELVGASRHGNCPDPFDDCNDNNFPDVCEPDCNSNTVADECDVRDGTSEDVNHNVIPDECEDCNENGILDDIDISSGTSLDCNENLVPDECDILVTDCNTNAIPDECDIADGTSNDCQGNGIPDECDTIYDCDGDGIPDVCQCTPWPKVEVVAKNRYLSFMPDSVDPLCSASMAIRVTLTDLPAPFDAMEGNIFWVGEPHPITEISGLGEPDDTPPTFTGARLQCDPHCTDWGSVGLVHAFGPAIIPGAIYEMQAVECSCDLGIEDNYSTPLVIDTASWGDMVPPYAGAASDQPDFTDISAVVDKFRNLPDAPIKAQADVADNGPDTRVDFVDIGYVVDAFRGGSYPFAGPSPCNKTRTR